MDEFDTKEKVAEEYDGYSYIYGTSGEVAKKLIQEGFTKEVRE